MAKKRKKEKEAVDKYEFVPPEFDEKQFLMDEMKSTKRLLLIVAYGVLFGILAAIVTIMERSGYFGLVLFLIGGSPVLAPPAATLLTTQLAQSNRRA